MALQLRHHIPEAKLAHAVGTETVDLGLPWLCPQRHLLGYVKRLNGIRRLYLAEGHVITGLAEIRCPVCGMAKAWPWGEERTRG